MVKVHMKHNLAVFWLLLISSACSVDRCYLPFNQKTFTWGNKLKPWI